MSNSASVSLLIGVSDGILSQSIRSIVAAPFTYWTVKFKAIKREFSLWSLGFSISSRYHLLSIWYQQVVVCKDVEVLKSLSQYLAFCNSPHYCKYSFSSIVVYCNSASERNCDPACMRVQSSPDFC